MNGSDRTMFSMAGKEVEASLNVDSYSGPLLIGEFFSRNPLAKASYDYLISRVDRLGRFQIDETHNGISLRTRFNDMLEADVAYLFSGADEPRIDQICHRSDVAAVRFLHAFFDMHPRGGNERYEYLQKLLYTTHAVAMRMCEASEAKLDMDWQRFDFDSLFQEMLDGTRQEKDSLWQFLYQPDIRRLLAKLHR